MNFNTKIILSFFRSSLAFIMSWIIVSEIGYDLAQMLLEETKFPDIAEHNEV